MMTYHASFVTALTYTWAQNNVYAPVSLYFISLKACYLPLALLVIDFLNGGLPGLTQGLVGYTAGHAYLYFDTLLPLAGGPRLIPSVTQPPSGPSGQSSGSSFGGKGRRLGS